MSRLLLFIRLLIVFAAGALFATLGYYAHKFVDERRDTEAERQNRAVWMRMLEQQLGSGVLREHSELVERALQKDPYGALVIASGTEGDRYAAMKNWLESGRESAEMQIQRITLEAVGKGRVLPTDARAFADSAISGISLFQMHDPAYADKLLHNLTNKVSPSEYSNIANDFSYLQIAISLHPEHREIFRQHQGELTPILAAADPEEWDSLVAAFEVGEPRLDQILADPDQGWAYGLIYLLHRDAVERLKGVGIKEAAAIEFMGLNAGVIREVNSDDPSWPGRVKRAAKMTAAQNTGNGRTVFDWSLVDPTIFWVLCPATIKIPQ